MTILTCGNQLHDRIISLRGEVWTHKTYSAPLLLRKCLYQVWKVHLYKCVRVCVFLFHTILDLLDFGTFPTVIHFSFYI